MPALVRPFVASGVLSGHVQPSLRVDELVLRPWQDADAPVLAQAYRDPAIQRWHCRSMTEGEALSWVRSGVDLWTTDTGGEWAVSDHDAPVGRVRMRLIDPDEGEAEAGYWVLPAARGRSVAARALSAVTEWMCTEAGLHRIVLRHSTRNPASCRVADKAGYLLEGTLRQQVLHVDGWHDMHLHARLAGDFHAAS